MKKILLFLILFVTIFYTENVYADKAKCVYENNGYRTTYTVGDNCYYDFSTVKKNESNPVYRIAQSSINMNGLPKDKSFFSGTDCPEKIYYGVKSASQNVDLYDVSLSKNFGDASLISNEAKLVKDESYTTNIQSCFSDSSVDDYKAKCVYNTSSFKVTYTVGDNCSVNFNVENTASGQAYDHNRIKDPNTYGIEKDLSFFENGECPSSIYFGTFNKNGVTYLNAISKKNIPKTSDIDNVFEIKINNSASYINDNSCLQGAEYAKCSYIANAPDGSSYTVTYSLFESCNLKYKITSSNPNNVIQIPTSGVADLNIVTAVNADGKKFVSCPAQLYFKIVKFDVSTGHSGYALSGISTAGFADGTNYSDVVAGNINVDLVNNDSACFRTYNRTVQLNGKVFDICNSKGVLRTLNIVHVAITIMKIIAPLILIIVGTVALGKASIAGDDKAIKDATSALIKKSIIAVVIFILPFIAEFIISLVGDKAAGSQKNDFPYCADCLTGDDSCEEHIEASKNR